MSRQSSLLYAGFAVFGALYLAALHLGPYPGRYIVKAIPIFCLAWLIQKRIPGKIGRWMFLGLLFSGIGDIALDLRFAVSFAVGVAAFAIAHLFYIFALFRSIEIKRLRTLLAPFIAAYGVIFSYKLFSTIGIKGILFVPYVAIICLMGVSAVLGGKNHCLIILGACLFIFSDSVIAVNGFMRPIAYSGYWIMTTYYAGQLLIASGIIKSYAQEFDEA